MAEANPAGTAAASNPPAFDQAAFAKQMAEASASAMAEAMKPFAERLAKLEPAAEPAPKSGKTNDRNLTAEDVGRIVGDQLKAHQSSESKRQARDRFAQNKMKDVPAAYLTQLPETESETELAAAEQRIRTQLQADLKALGVVAKDVGAAAGEGDSPATRGKGPDWSKVPATKKIENLVASSSPSFQGTQKGEEVAAA